MTRSPALPRTVVVLGLVSLLNDAASEMIAPLLPIFLTAALGAGPAVVGLVEGVAEATSSLLKLWSGRAVDRRQNHKTFVVGGYGVANVARPLIGLAASWPVVLGLRFADRVGKGLRSAPRDVLIADAVPAAHRGRAFGFHRAMDHLGATLGPIAAFVLLQAGLPMRDVFLWSVVPGVLLMGLAGAGLPPRRTAPVPRTLPPLRWTPLPSRLRALIAAAGGLALATVPEAFLVLWAAEHGLAVPYVPLLWAAAHVGKSVLAGTGGWLADRFGRLPIVVAGWLGRVGVLGAMAVFSGALVGVWVLFFAYAAALAFSEGAERALIGDLAPERQRATAFGLYHMIAGLLALPGALLVGAVWQAAGSPAALMLSAGLTALAATTLIVLARRE